MSPSASRSTSDLHGWVDRSPTRRSGVGPTGAMQGSDRRMSRRHAADEEGGELTHLDDEGRAHMVDVGEKAVTHRVCVARCAVHMAPAKPSRRITAGDMPKGDVFATARIAGIQAAKRTDRVDPAVLTRCRSTRSRCTSTPDTPSTVVRRRSRPRRRGALEDTGVEMEALVAASAAALTLYDMCKAIDRGMTIDAVRLVAKTGGKSGTWVRPGETAPNSRGRGLISARADSGGDAGSDRGSGADSRAQGGEEDATRRGTGRNGRRSGFTDTGNETGHTEKDDARRDTEYARKGSLTGTGNPRHTTSLRAPVRRPPRTSLAEAASSWTTPTSTWSNRWKAGDDRAFEELVEAPPAARLPPPDAHDGQPRRGRGRRAGDVPEPPPPWPTFSRPSRASRPSSIASRPTRR